MGIPGCFLKYVRKYPATIIKEKIHMIDSLYLDFNCAIHPCCRQRSSTDYHHNRKDIIEKHMIQDCIDYMLKLITYANPRRLVYLSIDGVAPRAKMAQQRYRRFKSVKDKEVNWINELIQDAGYASTHTTSTQNTESEPESEPKSEHWDTNAITPGTIFMQKLADAIRLYVNTSNDPLLQSLTFIISDSNQPGEGEHKILNHIREHSEDVIKGHDIIIYGLDADLMMLAMLSHVNQIKLLRESIEFGKEFQSDTVQFCYLDIDFLKYSILTDLKEMIPYDMEMTQQIKLIDDYIFLCFFIGNDFVPRLPPLNIKEGGLDLLLDVYCQVFTNMTKTIKKYGWSRDSSAFSGDGIKTGTEMSEGAWKMNKSSYQESFEFQNLIDIDNCRINFPFFEKVLYKLSLMEDRLMLDLEEKRSRMKPRLGITHNDDERRKAIIDAYPIYQRNSSNSAEARIDVQNRDRQWTRRYYKETTKNEPTIHNIDETCHQYLQGLVWVLTYYYQGCVSWSWYYPHHHAPSIYDLHKFVSTPEKRKSLKLIKDKPYKPFEQLMIVLPPQSRHLLPTNAQSLMTSHSPLAQFYPEKYEFDPIFRKFYWECGPVLPPIDDDEIRSELNKKKLTSEEQKRNQNRGADIYIGVKVPT